MARDAMVIETVLVAAVAASWEGGSVSCQHVMATVGKVFITCPCVVVVPVVGGIDAGRRFTIGVEEDDA